MDKKDTLSYEKTKKNNKNMGSSLYTVIQGLFYLHTQAPCQLLPLIVTVLSIDDPV